MPHGFTGKVLRVDLSEKTSWIEEPEERVYRACLGGSGLALHYLLRELKPDVDPLGPENLLVFATSILVGTPGPGLSRFTVAAKSPLTGGYGKAEAGGWWGPELKFAGFDAVVVSGRSPSPVYLYIGDGAAEIKDASHLWGLDTGDVENLIRHELGDQKVRVAQIGPAGQSLVRYACVLNELKHANGRTGMGAVMGSKRLLGIAVRGSAKPALSDPEKMEALRRQILARYQRRPGDMHDVGTSGILISQDARGMLPTRNFRDGSFEGATEISGQTMRDTILTGRGTCYACPIACKRVIKLEEPYQVDPAYGGPEYETLAALGSLCGVSDLAAIAKGNELCNRYGLDTISAGATIAFAMECFEAGYLTEKETDGMDLHFGNTDAMLKLIPMISRREGVGDLLAEGALAASRKIGGKAADLVLHVKGQEFPMHEPRAKRALALGYAVSASGADHNESHFDNLFEDANSPGIAAHQSVGIQGPVPMLDLGPAKVRLFFLSEQVKSLYNCIGLCQFVAGPLGPFTLQLLSDFTGAVTGWDTSLYELMKASERALTMGRLFDLRQGLGSAEDDLPARMFQPLRNGALEGVALDRREFEDARRLYYEMMGWHAESGVPTRGKLAELGLLWVTE
jgi:aldehyde:ferredoxin oxidoreductase